MYRLTLEGVDTSTGALDEYLRDWPGARREGATPLTLLVPANLVHGHGFLEGLGRLGVNPRRVVLAAAVERRVPVYAG